MLTLLNALGLLGFLAGIVGVLALWAQRDANREREEAERQSKAKRGHPPA